MRKIISAFAYCVASVLHLPIAHAQYGNAESLRAELQGPDLIFTDATGNIPSDASLGNRVWRPALTNEAVKHPAIVVMHTCAGVSQHIKLWTERALGEGFVVLPVASLRGIAQDCGSPSKISNGRWVKDALDAVAHLAAKPFVDPLRISVLGFSKGAMAAQWSASGSVAAALRADAPRVAAAASLYAFCGLQPTRGRPQGITILQPDTDRPLLVLMGEKDNETPPSTCLDRLQQAKSSGKPVQWHLYPGATHAWDSPDKSGLVKTDFKGDRVTYQYDADVTKDSMDRVLGLFKQAHVGR